MWGEDGVLIGGLQAVCACQKCFSQDLEIRLHSQLSVPPLPMKQDVQFPGVPEAAREVGMVGVAALMDVQLDQVETRELSPFNSKILIRS